MTEHQFWNLASSLQHEAHLLKKKKKKKKTEFKGPFLIHRFTIRSLFGTVPNVFSVRSVPNVFSVDLENILANVFL